MQSFTSPAETRAAWLPRRPIPGLARRRLVLLLPSALLGAVMIGAAVSVLRQSPHPLLDWTLLVPFGLAATWDSFFVWQTILGFISWLRGDDGQSKLERRAATIEPVATGKSRTALALPIYEEDVDAVLARVRIMGRSLARLGSVDDIDIHVLSDTRSSEIAAAEEAAFAGMVAEPGAPRMFYRRRATNTGRKAGNLQDFFVEAGSRYDFAVVLDADSLMSGAAVRRLIRLMEENPRCGLIQTVSYAAGRETLFARIQQFAVRLYAPLSLRGLDFWQGVEGSYWGHNAILRIAPFLAHCRLPVLPGKPPLGGEILCHDIVEAALLARAGWETRLLPEFEGTWEEMPTNALDLLGRERRWCQGNLQHARLLAIPGLRAASRGHIALGIVSYLTAPLRWLFLIGGAIRVLVYGTAGGAGLLAFGLTEHGLAAGVLVVGSVFLTVTPLLLNIGRVLSDRALVASYGGSRRLLGSAALEQGFWLLFGPVFTFVTSGFVAKTLGGRAVGWGRQHRDDRHVGAFEAFRCHRLHLGVGAALGLIAWRAGDGWYSLWMAPVIVGLLLSPVLTALSSRRDLGLWSRRVGLFLTPDDRDVAPELAELTALLAER